MRARSSSSAASGSNGRYSLAGFTVDSELPLPELLPADDFADADVNVRVCRRLPAARDLVDVGEGWRAGPQAVVFDVPGTGRYLVRGGREILIAPALRAKPASLRLFLLGSAFGALFHQRGLLPLHAGGIVTPSGCVGFGGDTGAGKSTLTAYLRKRGYRSLADDVLVIDVSASQPRALPGYPQTKLWADTAEALGIDTGTCAQIDEQRDKFCVGIDRQASFCPKAQPFRRFYVLADADDPPGIERLEGVEALAELTRNTYRAFLLEPMGRMGAHFSVCAALARRVGVYRLSRRRELCEMDDVLDLLEAHFDGRVE